MGRKLLGTTMDDSATIILVDSLVYSSSHSLYLSGERTTTITSESLLDPIMFWTGYCRFCGCLVNHARKSFVSHKVPYFLAPIKEELLYRGFLLNRLCTIVGFWPAAIVSSAIFALGHRNPFSAFLSGIWLSTLYSPTLGGSLVFPIMIHMIQNITSNMLSLPKGFFF
ncbi:MAG: CPBP family intramembrane glutamic endopeptidase [Bacillota bacterium]|jgi:hypothetical protein